MVKHSHLSGCFVLFYDCNLKKKPTLFSFATTTVAKFVKIVLNVIIRHTCGITAEGAKASPASDLYFFFSPIFVIFVFVLFVRDGIEDKHRRGAGERCGTEPPPDSGGTRLSDWRHWGPAERSVTRHIQIAQ